ncbi:hypothetical protein KM176_19205 [Pseudooceanicola sp. CBS1P-1]|uniref:DUF2946 domain-containing protein n=1 Tax=Pseudooceanicola albus TaxID=2692189 RepID=A0A6L7G689_9RHOB|nr:MULTISPECIES: hypothetical protein [Pseudooceanicola]MBT9386008.1 hypothetical protein [Pseudooceanicola endophyticus]MXN19571.1 hypothetical protein [Pseudooceanicola albus]
MAALRRPFLAVLAALVLSMVSVFSAMHMAPAPDSRARIEAQLILGADPGDLCGMPEMHMGYHCPFCHALPEPPEPAAPDRHVPLARALDLPRLAAFVLPRARLDFGLTARAPPLPA